MDQYKLVKEIIKTCKYFKIMEYETDNNLVQKKIIDGLKFTQYFLSKNEIKKISTYVR